LNPPATIEPLTGVNRPQPQYDAADVEFVLSVPESNLSARALGETFRLVELLLCFRAITPQGVASDQWYGKFVHFIASDSAALAQILTCKQGVHQMIASHSADCDLFDIWVDEISLRRPVLVVSGIERGSYEFAFHLVNLVAIFGLQEYGVVKDVVQWLANALQDIVSRAVSGNISVKSGTVAQLELSPQLLRSLRQYDSVEIIETTSKERRQLKIKLSRK
jgi:hypothetical protein